MIQCQIFPVFGRTSSSMTLRASWSVLSILPDSRIPDILRHVLLEYCSKSSILFFRSDISLLRSSMTELNFPEIAFLNDSLLISRFTACSVRLSSFPIVLSVNLLKLDRSEFDTSEIYRHVSLTIYCRIFSIHIITHFSFCHRSPHTSWWFCNSVTSKINNIVLSTIRRLWWYMVTFVIVFKKAVCWLFQRSQKLTGFNLSNFS